MAEECEQFDAEHEESLQLQRRQQQSLSSTLSKGYELRKRIGKGDPSSIIIIPLDFQPRTVAFLFPRN
ncbi:MAG: hypothetical protein MHMPM18_004464 [Marteilia pararefringens]